MKSIASVPSRDGKSTFWSENPECSGFTVSDKNCTLRTTEMELVTYTPIQCLKNKINCDDLVAFVRYNIRDQVVSEAQLQFATTIFTCIILTAASLTFSNDTETIVIVPIQKQIGIIKTLADDPLRQPEKP